MNQVLQGKNAVVTGAGRGIGREIALAFAHEGARVVVNDYGVARDGTNPESGPADETVAEIKKLGGTALANYDSVSDYEGANRIIKTCLDGFGRIDILVNVAGFVRERMVYNMSEEDWDAVLGVHLKGTFNCTRHASVSMREQKYGRIINTVSVAWLGTVGQSNYGAAKGGIVSFTYCMARELGRYGITCNGIAPVAATRMTLNEKVEEGYRKRYEAGLITKENLERILNLPSPEYTPPMVVYLTSDHASNINGQIFRVQAQGVGIYSPPVLAKYLHRDYTKYGPWSIDELVQLVPETLLTDYANPAPSKPEKQA